MAGRSLDELFPRIAHQAGEEVLRLEALSGSRLPRAAGLVLHRGEILGIGGLMGSGRSELLRAVFGLDAVRSGRIRVGGLWDRGRPPWQRLAQGVGMLSEDRKQEGLAQAMSIADNLTLCHLTHCARLGLVDRRTQRERATRRLRELSVVASDAGAEVSSLSGGNQQKVALARLLDRVGRHIVLQGVWVQADPEGDDSDRLIGRARETLAATTGGSQESATNPA
jgi:ribose transport system ATP-binding protein